MDSFPWLIGLAVIALLWWHALGARMKARRAAQRACRKAELHFIDELAFKRIELGHNARGQWCVKRHYVFEFYHTGDRRYGGSVEMHAQHVARIQLDPYPVETAP